MERRRRNDPPSRPAPPSAAERVSRDRGWPDPDDGGAFAAIEAELRGPFGDASGDRSARRPRDAALSEPELDGPRIDGLASRGF